MEYPQQGHGEGLAVTSSSGTSRRTRTGLSVRSCQARSAGDGRNRLVPRGHVGPTKPALHHPRLSIGGRRPTGRTGPIANSAPVPIESQGRALIGVPHPTRSQCDSRASEGVPRQSLSAASAVADFFRHHGRSIPGGLHRRGARRQSAGSCSCPHQMSDRSRVRAGVSAAFLVHTQQPGEVMRHADERGPVAGCGEVGQRRGSHPPSVARPLRRSHRCRIEICCAKRKVWRLRIERGESPRPRCFTRTTSGRLDAPATIANARRDRYA